MTEANMIALDTADTFDVDEAVADAQTAAMIGQTLVYCYPGYTWHVEAFRRQGVAKIINCEFSGGPGARPWGFVIPLNEIATVSELAKKVMLAGGELLERYGQHTGARDEARAAAAPRDFKGAALGDLS